MDLHNKFGAGQDNLITKYSVSSTPDLAKLAGEPIKGKWMLKVADLGKEDVGKLNSWSLKIVPLSSQGKPQVPRDTPLIRV